jgi:xanthine/CO dehydrogenase XdhC/CoxF family maturation factor
VRRRRSSRASTVPIGLPLGGRSPEEIAMAIMAEVVAVRYGKRQT